MELLKVYVEHPLFCNRPIEIEWDFKFIPRIGENFLFNSFINEKDRRYLLYDWIQDVIQSEGKKDACYKVNEIDACKKVWQIYQKLPGENDVLKWLHLWYIIENGWNKISSEEIADKDTLSNILKTIMDYMIVNIENWDTTCTIDQIIWSQSENVTSVTIIMREINLLEDSDFYSNK